MLLSTFFITVLIPLAIIQWIGPVLQVFGNPTIYQGIGVVVVAIGAGRIAFDTLKAGKDLLISKISPSAKDLEEMADAARVKEAERRAAAKARPATAG